MRLHVLQHVPFEGPGAIGAWAEERGHELTASLALTEEFPPVEEVDLLVVMGGPMAADDEVASAWLPAEKHYIAETIAAGRPLLGVCLGAQILAEVLGGRVRRNEHPEIGWYPTRRTWMGSSETLFSAWGDELVVGHWHGDTFDLPVGLEPVYSSSATRNQAFVFDGRVVGLQFHVEWTPASLADLMAACADELGGAGAYEMSVAELAEGAQRHLGESHDALFSLLDALAATAGGVAGDGAL